jgi:hypothetical protein
VLVAGFQGLRRIKDTTNKMIKINKEKRLLMKNRDPEITLCGKSKKNNTSPRAI